MDAMRRWPLWLVMVVLAVVFAGITFLISFVTKPSDVLLERAVSAGVSAVVFGVLFGLWIGRQRRRGGDAVLDPSFGRAFRRGEVPDDADPEQWRRALRNQVRLHRWQRWFAPVVFVPVIALAVLLAIFDRPVWWVAVASFLGFLILSAVQTPRVLRKTAAMLAELDRRDGVTDTH